MKKFVVPFLLLAALLTFIKIGFALSGSVYSPSEKQLLADGDMEKSGTTGWSSYQAVLSKQTTSPHGGVQNLRITASGAGNGVYAIQAILTIGKRYRFTGWARSDGTKVPIVFLGGNGSSWTGTNSASWQRIDFVGTCLGNTWLYLGFDGSSSGYVEFDDLMVTEYAGYVQVQDTQKLADGDMEAVDFASWTTGTTINTKVASTLGGSGLRVAHLAYNVSATGGILQIVLTAGKKYRMTGWARGDGTATPGIYNSGWAWAGTSSATWQRIDVVFTALGSDFRCWSYGQAAGTYVEYDNIMVTEYKGEVKVINKQLVVDGDMELAAATTTSGGAWSATTAYISKQTTNPHGGGRLIRVKANGVQTYGFAYQATLTVGKKYRIAGWARSDGTDLPVVYIGSHSASPWTGTNSTSWQRFDFVDTCAGNVGSYFGQTTASSGYVEFDDVFVTLTE